jgi:BioD-like phosphotransacetylase family protein
MINSTDKKIYVAATRQNDGKTITALGLFDTLSAHFNRIGYIKPVGQQVKIVGDYMIDKDVTLMDEIFHIGNELPDMSPVTIPDGFTKEYILHGDVSKLKERIMSSYLRASHNKDFMVIEGTGHAGVGSVFDLSNAAVAKLLNTNVILVTCAGIGKPIDEVMLNKALFDSYGINVIGVIINKVLPEKYESIDKYVRLGFKNKGIEVLGVVPYNNVLANPTIRQLLEDIRGELISGEHNLDQAVSKMIVGAMPAHAALEFFTGDVLLITPGNREDLILAAISCNFPGVEDYSVRGIILTGGIWPNKSILNIIKGTKIPTIIVKDDTFMIAQKIANLITKIRPEDIEKVKAVKELVKQYINIDVLLDKIPKKQL